MRILKSLWYVSIDPYENLGCLIFKQAPQVVPMGIAVLAISLSIYDVPADSFISQFKENTTKKKNQSSPEQQRELVGEVKKPETF